MKSFKLTVFALLIMYSTGAWSNVCKDAWPEKDKSCQLLWSDKNGEQLGLEIAYMENKCFIHEGDESINCLQVRDCRSKNSEHERYIYFEQAKLDYLCEKDGEVEIYKNKNLAQAKAYVICKKGKPEKIVLQAPLLKKDCSFFNKMKVRN